MILLLIAFLAVGFCQTTTNAVVRFFEPDPPYECPVPDLNNECVSRCENALLDCILGCNDDVGCLSECIRLQTECTNACPCEYDCLLGCTDCGNPVCQCEEKETNYDWNQCLDDNSLLVGRCLYQCNHNMDCVSDCYDEFAERYKQCPCEENCIGGCPCENYSCSQTTPSPDVTTTLLPETTTSPIANAVLVLNTWNAANKPMIVDFDGNVNENLNFEYGEGVSAHLGCGATLFGEFWYFGSGTLVGKIIGCQLVRQADMAFNFTQGSCNTFLEPTPKVLLCFDLYDPQACHTFDGDFYYSVESSKYSHLNTFDLANYKNKALTTGCQQPFGCGVKTEWLNMETLQWSDGPDYPFTSNVIAFYSATQTSDAAYIIGGQYTQNIIAEFKNGQWRQLNGPNTGRYFHGSITLGSQTMIIGGYASSNVQMPTEIWQLESGSNKIVNPTLTNNSYCYGIGLFAVDFNFCKK